MANDRIWHRAATPVLAGVGERAQRPDDGTAAEPLDLLADAVTAAAADSGAAGEGRALLDLVDHLDVVHVVSWLYDDLPARLAGRLGLHPARTAHSEVGGEQPTTLIDRAAARISAGESQVAVIAGGEAFRTLDRFRRQGALPPWTPPPPGATPLDPATLGTPLAWRHGLRFPSGVYPLFEHPSRATLGQTTGEALDWAARVWAGLSEVAANNPSAWSRRPRTAAEIRTPGPDNRMVSYPYPKLMNALLSVDQAAAVIVTSAEVAARLGLDPDRLVYPVGGAGAADAHDFLARPTFARTAAGAAALDGALTVAGRPVEDVDLLELYSCFPCVVRMASTHLGLPPDRPVSVTGGLTFFGGPANAYMLHAAAAMVRALRAGDGTTGLLYGQGGLSTKHHAMVLDRCPDPRGYGTDNGPARQLRVDAEPHPGIAPEADGDGTLETFTVAYERTGEPSRGIVVGRLGAGGAPDHATFPTQTRFVAVTDDPDDIARLTDPGSEVLGCAVRVKPGAGGVNIARLT